MTDHSAELRAIYGGRRWILANDVLAGATADVEALTDLGVDDLLVVAGSRGTGPVPEGVPARVLGLRAPTMMAAIHAFDHALESPDDETVRAVVNFDPERRARVITPMFSQVAIAADRRVWGARRASWRALEDKTIIDALWRAVGVPRATSTVVPADPGHLHAAAAALDDGAGTVWVADNRRGWHGGASGLRWVRTPSDVDAAAVAMAERADAVRVMPFLEGIPCSIHGLVMPDMTLAFRPCEMVVLRRPGRQDLLYAGMGSTWSPTRADRDAMRLYARRVGDHLRAALGYRGAFSIDGVMTAVGFRPTELNPRFSAALAMLGASAALPLNLLHLAVVEGVAVRWRDAELERTVVAAADRSPAARVHVLVDRAPDQESVALRRGPDGWRVVEDAPQVTVHGGPASAGGFVRIEIHRPPAGVSIAPFVCSVLGWIDRSWDLRLGPLVPAEDVRPA